MGRHPADAAFKEGKLEILVAIQQPGAKNAGQPRHDRKYSRQHAVWKMMLEKLVHDRKLQAEVDSNRHLYTIGLGEKYLMIGMIESFRSRSAVDHDRCYAHVAQT